MISFTRTNPFNPSWRFLLFLFCTLLPQSVLHADWTWENDIAEAQTTRETYTASFRFRNNGKKDLSVTQLQSCCNCTTHSFVTSAAKPGQTGTLRIVVDRAKSKTSKTVFDFLAVGPQATPTTLQFRIPESRAKE